MPNVIKYHTTASGCQTSIRPRAIKRFTQGAEPACSHPQNGLTLAKHKRALYTLVITSPDMSGKEIATPFPHGITSSFVSVKYAHIASPPANWNVQAINVYTTHAHLQLARHLRPNQKHCTQGSTPCYLVTTLCSPSADAPTVHI